jgi:hypothetical protein
MNHSSVKYETVLAIFLTTNVRGLTEEWFILLWLVILLTITV